MMHNMIIEAPVEDDQPLDFMGPLATLDEVQVEFSAFRNRDQHNRFQEDLVEHLWTRRGNA
jgi:hypothetical protein